MTWPRARSSCASTCSPTSPTPRQLTGRTLPGPLPGKETDPDPATGITDVEAS